jgi:gas vesicle protein GvpK
MRKQRVSRHPVRTRRRPSTKKRATQIATLSARDLRSLQKKIKSRTPIARWNPDRDEVQRSVVQLVLTLVELIRRLMERQAIRRMSERTFSKGEAEAVGTALMEIERTVHRLAGMFNLTPEDLNLDLQAIKLL